MAKKVYAPSTKETKAPIVDLRHKEFVQRLADPESPTFLNQTQSYKAVYPDANGTAKARACQLMDRPEVQDEFLVLMERQGLTDSNLNDVHEGLLRDKDGNLRIKAVRMAHELKGRLGPRNHVTESRSVNLNINLDAGTPTPAKLGQLRNLLG